MSALRKSIRHKMAQVLAGSVDLVGERVHRNRVLPWHHEELPAIGIYSTGEEQVEERQTLELLRRARMSVEIVVDAMTGEVDDQCDDIAEQVEQNLFACPYLDGLVGNIALVDIEGPVIVAEGQVTVAMMSLNFLAEYTQDTPTDATTPNQDMETVHVTMDLVDANNETPESTDIIDTSAPTP